MQVLIRSPHYCNTRLIPPACVSHREMDLSIYVGICSPPSISVIATVFQPFMYCTKTLFVRKIFLVQP